MSSQKKISVIINPKSGHGRGLRIFEKINEERKNNSLIGDYVKHVDYTSPDDNSETLKKMAADSDVLLICGGDGTVHNIINDIVSSNISVAAISIYPTGTGNDLCRSLGLYKYKNDVIPLIEKLITSPDYASLDIFSVNESVLFTNYVSFGYDAYILSAYESWVNRMKEFKLFEITMLKKFLFAVIGLFAALFYRKKIFESLSKRTCINVIVSNLRTYAGGSIISEKSSMNDKSVEVSYVGTKLEYMKLILNRFRLLPFDISPESKGSPLSLNFHEKVPVQVDGEDYGAKFANVNEFRIRLEAVIRLCI